MHAGYYALQNLYYLLIRTLATNLDIARTNYYLGEGGGF